MGKLSLPLPGGFFECPPLNEKEQRYLISKARESAKILVEASRSNGGRVRWTPAGRYKGVQMYRGEDKFATPSTSNSSDTKEYIEYCCGVTTVAGTLEEVAAFFDLSSTEKMKEFSLHYNHDVLDGAVLYTLVPPTLKNRMHQVTVKWTAFEMPSSLFKNRDFCTLECQDVFTDTTGRRGWVRSYDSVKLPACPSQQEKLGLVRGSLYHSGYVFVESDRRGFLDAIHCIQVNLSGNLQKNLPQRLHFAAMKRRIATVAMINTHLQQKRFSAQHFLGELELVPKNQRSHCALCSMKFHFLVLRKTRCRKCGEVICLSCSSQWTVNQTNMSHNGVSQRTKIRVCMNCIDKHNQEREQYLEEIASVHIASRFVENLKEQQQQLLEIKAKKEKKKRQVQEQHLYPYELLLRQKLELEKKQKQKSFKSKSNSKMMRFNRVSNSSNQKDKKEEQEQEEEEEEDKEDKEEEEEENHQFLLRLRQQERQEQLQASQEFYYARNRPSVMGLMHTRRKKPLSDPETSSSSSDFSHEESPDQSNGGLTSKLLEEHNHIHRPYSKLQPPFIGSIRQAKKQTQAQQEYAYTTRQHLCAGSSPAYDEYGYEYSDRGEYGAVTGEANGFSIRRRLEEKHTALLRQREHLMTCQRVSYGTVGGRHYPTQFMHQQHSLTRVGSGSCGSSRSRCILEYLTPPSYAEAMSVAELAEITHSRAHVASSERSWRTLSGGRSDKSGTSRGRFSQLDAHAEDLGPDELQLLMEKYQMGGYMETESDESSECIEVEDDEDEEDLGKLSVTNSVVNTFTRIMESQDHFFFEDHFRISLGSDMDEEEKNKGIELDMTNQLVVLNETQILSNIEEEKSQEPEKQVVSHEKQAAITERMASPIPAETKAEIDTNLLIARLYEKILTLTKKQYALASSSSKQEEKNSVDEELRQLYQQLNEITLVQE